MNADSIITNAKVYTVDPGQPHAEAVAISGNRIAGVGTEAEIASLRGPNTEIIDGQGKTLLPGLIDSHFHLYMGSMGLGALQLEDVTSLAELSERIRQYVADHPNQLWIEGQGLAYNIVDSGQPITRHHLDAILPDRLIILRSIDLHTAWVNTIVLEQADIFHGRALPSPAEVVMGVDGLATGQLNESDAMSIVTDLMPQPSHSERLDLLRQGLARLATFGITSIHNMFGDSHQFELYAQLEEAGDLSCRLYVPYHFTPEMSVHAIEREAIPLRAAYQSDMLRGGSIKIFMDGVIESYTSLMLEPYANGSHSLGDALFTAEQFNEIAAQADQHGFQIKVHAIGDGAIRRTLDGFAHAQTVNGMRDSRHRIEHIELLHNDDLPRFTESGVLASMQPLHASRPDIGYYENWMHCVGAERYHAAFRWRDLRNVGVPICLGSDWPVVTMNPYAGMEAAVNQQAWGQGLVNQALTLEETLTGYTRAGAYAEFMEERKGMIRLGMLADLVLLDVDLFAIEPTALKEVRPLMTMCDGKVVYQQ
ncbi:MAG: amidohydrolase [Chloroflexota bacterium]